MTTRPRRRSSVRDTVKKVLNLPREQYVPLPIGGYPLPSIIKRRFALPPQLSSASRLSLLPDFASSLYGEQWSKAIQHSVERENRCRPQRRNSLDDLRVRYSILVPEDAMSTNNANQILCTIRDIPNRNRTLRRVRGRENLLGSSNRSIVGTASSGIPALWRNSSFSQASEFEEVSSDLTLIAGDSGAEESKVKGRPISETSIDSVETAFYRPAEADPERIISAIVIDHVLQLLSSFCILDLQISGHPIRVTSLDLLPQDSVAEDDALFLDDTDIANPWEIKTICSRNGQAHHVVIEGDLIDVSGDLPCASHRFTGQLDVTTLISIIELEHGSDESEEDIDVWLEIAYEEMDRLGIRRRQREVAQTNSTPASTSKDKALRVLKDLHKDYLIIGPSGPERAEYCITHLSPNLLNSADPHNNPLDSLLDVDILTDSLNYGERFAAQTEARGSETPKRLYCLPMFGPELSCWLCFFVDGDLPFLW